LGSFLFGFKEGSRKFECSIFQKFFRNFQNQVVQSEKTEASPSSGKAFTDFQEYLKSRKYQY
jgi:hypothetical protein